MNSPAVVGRLERKVRPAERSCKSCRFFDVRPDAKGRIVVCAKSVYECLVVVPEPALPDSIKLAYGYRWPPDKAYLNGDSGRKCPTWEQRA